MKIFRIVKVSIAVLSFVFFGIACVFGAITLKSSDIALSTALLVYSISGFVGFSLFFSKNEIAHRVGLGLTLGAMVVSLFYAISGLETSSCAIIALVAVILFAIYYLVELIGFIACGDSDNDDPELDPRVKKIIGWKKLVDEGIISSSEFEKKRNEILGLKVTNEKK